MNDRESELIRALETMEEEAPSLGLCPLTFAVMREIVWEIIAERDALKRESVEKKE